MTVQYKPYEFQIHDCLVKAEKLLAVIPDSSQDVQWVNKINSLRQNLEQRKFRVAVVGEFNRGKTSFVNALLGREILPVDYIPTTASINRITYGDTPNAYILTKDGKKISVEISELANYVTKLSEDSAEKAALIDEAVVEYPSFFCRNGVDLIDTPGMNDETPMNQITISKLENIDIAIVTVDASLPFSMTECSFTAQLLESKQVCQIIIVITKIDMIDKDEQQKIYDFTVKKVRKDVGEYLSKNNAPQTLISKYHEIFDNPIVFPVSSTDALHALKINDLALFKTSGFARLNDELPLIILRNQNSNLILNSVRRLLEILNNYELLFYENKATKKQRVSIITNLEEFYGNLLPDSPEEIIDFSQNFMKDIQISAQKKFVQALAKMKTFSHNELREHFTPIIKNQFHEINRLLLNKESDKFFRYVADKEKQLLEKAEETQEVIKNFLPSSLCSSQFNEMFNGEGREKFYWTASLIPDENVLSINDWNIMPYVSQIIDNSLKDYSLRRTEELRNFFANIKKDLINKFAEIQEIFDKKQAELPDEEQLKELKNLEDRLNEIKTNFLAELYSGQGNKKINRKDTANEKMSQVQQ